jgi:hypothetical protein
MRYPLSFFLLKRAPESQRGASSARWRDGRS